MNFNLHECACIVSRRNNWHRLRGVSIAIVAAGIIFPVSDALALWDDRLELFAAETVTSDDNVFRISNRSNPTTILGSSEKGDTYRTTSVGFNLNVPVSRQRFQVNAIWSDNRYQRFTNLDFNGHDGTAVWLWQLGNDLSGKLGYEDTSSLASFSNVGGSTAAPLKTRQTFGDAAFMITPRWRLEAGARELKQANGDTTRQENDVNISNADFMLSYVTPRENSIGLSLRKEDGRYPNRQLVAGSLFDNAYTQHSVGTVIDWTITGKSHLNAHVDRINRDYQQLSDRNFAGTTFRVVYDWKPTGKLTLDLIAHRDISALENVGTSFVLIKGFELNPSLALTDKINLSGSLGYNIRDYLGNPGIVLGTLPNRRDRVRSISAAALYRLDRAITLGLSMLHEARSSNVTFADYKVNVVQLNVRIAF